MFVEVGKSKISAPFDRILQLLSSKGEHLAFVPNSSETSMMVNILSLKFPLLKVPGQHLDAVYSSFCPSSFRI